MVIHDEKLRGFLFLFMRKSGLVQMGMCLPGETVNSKPEILISLENDFSKSVQGEWQCFGFIHSYIHKYTGVSSQVSFFPVWIFAV